MGTYYVAKREPSPWAASFFIDKHGRRVRRISYHRTKRAATDALATAIVEVKEQTFSSPRDALRFDRLCDQFLDAKRTEVAAGELRVGTLAVYDGLVEMHLRPLLGPRRVRDVTRADVEALKAALLAEPSPALAAVRVARLVKAYGADEARWRDRAARPAGRRTVAKALVLLSSLFEYAIEGRAATYNPAKGVRKTRAGASGLRKVDTAHVLTVAEGRRLIEATPAFYRPLVRFAVETGLRQAELLGLQWGDVDLDAGLVRVRRQWKRGAFAELKTTNSQRAVPVTPGLVADLKRWRLACPKGVLDLVFPAAVVTKDATGAKKIEGRPLSASNFLKRVFYPAFARAGFERAELTATRFRFHDLRHTFGSQALAAGVGLVEVSRYLGHSSIAVTATVYAHFLPDAHDAARAKLADRYDGVSPRSESETEVKQLRPAGRAGGLSR